MWNRLLLALACHLVLAGGYWLCTPVLEAPREEVALVAARHAALGIDRADAYAALLGASLRASETPDVHPIVAPADGPGARRVRHAASEGLAHRAVRHLRLWSVLLGAITLVATFGMARAVFPAHPAIAVTASAMMACMPQFAASHAVLWHGTLLAAATHLALWCALWTVTRSTLHLGVTTLGALACGLALSLDRCAWFVALLSAGVTLRAWRDAPRAIAGVALLAGACVGGSALRTPLPPAQLALPLRGWGDLLASFVGEVGRGALPVPWPALAMTSVAIALAVPGFVRQARHAAASSLSFTALTLACSLGTGACVSFALREDLHGRAFLPALGPMLILTAAGLVTGTPGRALARRLPSSVFWLIAFAPSLSILLWQVRPALARPSDAAPARDAAFRELVLDLRSSHQAWAHSITGRDPVYESRPTFTWQPPVPPRPEAIAILDAAGRVLWTTDAAGPITTGTWPMPEACYAALPRGTELIWCLRRLDVPDHDRARAAPFGGNRFVLQ